MVKYRKYRQLMLKIKHRLPIKLVAITFKWFQLKCTDHSSNVSTWIDFFYDCKHVLSYECSCRSLKKTHFVQTFVVFFSCFYRKDKMFLHEHVQREDFHYILIIKIQLWFYFAKHMPNIKWWACHEMNGGIAIERQFYSSFFQHTHFQFQLYSEHQYYDSCNCKNNFQFTFISMILDNAQWNSHFKSIGLTVCTNWFHPDDIWNCSTQQNIAVWSQCLGIKPTDSDFLEFIVLWHIIMWTS